MVVILKLYKMLLLIICVSRYIPCFSLFIWIEVYHIFLNISTFYSIHYLFLFSQMFFFISLRTFSGLYFYFFLYKNFLCNHFLLRSYFFAAFLIVSKYVFTFVSIFCIFYPPENTWGRLYFLFFPDLVLWILLLISLS